MADTIDTLAFTLPEILKEVFIQSSCRPSIMNLPIHRMDLQDFLGLHELIRDVVGEQPILARSFRGKRGLIRLKNTQGSFNFDYDYVVVAERLDAASLADKAPQVSIFRIRDEATYKSDGSIEYKPKAEDMVFSFQPDQTQFAAWLAETQPHRSVSVAARDTAYLAQKIAMREQQRMLGMIVEYA